MDLESVGYEYQLLSVVVSHDCLREFKNDLRKEKDRSKKRKSRSENEAKSSKVSRTNLENVTNYRKNLNPKKKLQ